MYLQDNELVQRLCLTKQTKDDCLSGEGRTKCAWEDATDLGGCVPAKLSEPEILQGIFCPDSVALKFELCTPVQAQGTCQSYTQCAYDTSSPLKVLGASPAWQALGPCRPADWVKSADKVCIEEERPMS